MHSLVNFRILFLVAALALLLGVKVPESGAVAGDTPLRGYAWSDNVGWLSFSCENTSYCATSNYGVVIDASGVLSGYAWSDNIGWVSFHTFDLVGCPSGSCEARYNPGLGKLTGWARALVYQSAENGWDGWISLSGSNYGVTVDRSTGDLANYAWSDMVMGWLSFNCENTGVCGTSPYKVYALFSDIPLVELKADGALSVIYITLGQNAVISWNMQNVDSCVASSSPVDSVWDNNSIWNNPTNYLPSGSLTVSPAITTVYTLTCTGPRGTVQSSVTVNVQAVGAPVCGNSILESPEECDDGNTISGDGCSAVCAREIPAVPSYFNLEAVPSGVGITFPKDATNVCSDPVKITVNDLGTGYDKNIALSVSDWGGLTPSSSSFSDLTLSQSEYQVGSNFSACFDAADVTQGVYSVLIRGLGTDGKEDSIGVLFNMLMASPTWKEI
ncbi:MAG: myxococcus cysteine-rich repeat containing protein [Patescibacteria group bacterium]